MTKNDLVELLSTTHGLTKTQAKAIIASIETAYRDTLLRGEDVIIDGIGRLKILHQQARKGRNPRTGVEVNIPARRTIKIKPSSALIAAVN
jgi:integration host factor subunit alpha